VESAAHSDGQPLNQKQLEADIEQLYALGYLDYVRYEVVNENGKTGIVVHAKQDSRGTRFIESGLDFSGNDIDSGLNIRVGLLKTDVDKNGSELRVLTQLGQDVGVLGELYKPFGPPLRNIFLPRVFAEKIGFTQFDDDGNATGEFDVTDYGAEVLIGREFGRAAALFAGVRRYAGDVDVRIGDPSFESFDFDGGEYIVSFQYDRMDDRYFPSAGGVLAMTYINSNENLGADAEFEQVEFSGFHVWSKARHNFQVGARFDTTTSGDAPVYALFRAGGFTRLSGFRDNELIGQHFGELYTGYRYEVARARLFPAFTGATLEYGNAANDRSDLWNNGILNGSLYFGVRSPLGPVYVGFGFAEEGRNTYFVRVGNPFGRAGFGR
jgi:NTE family protein